MVDLTISTYNYDVFLSFRGEDTRCNFTDHLLKALCEATIATFFDEAEIQIGEFLKPELKSAIKSSRASIIVLSTNYASSTWCLDELALIMEQRKTSKHIVFPIFYHVKPSDVRKQRNSFGEAMAEHKQRMETESDEEKRSQWDQKIKKWKKALTAVADIKGEEANGSRRETILIEGIVKEISSRLELHKRSELPHIIGRWSWVEMITSFLKDRSKQSTEILTIWGMAGIGKTYLAHYIFKLHYLDFERSCFLEDIERRCTTPNGLLDLQKKLLKDIGVRSWMDIDDVNAGTMKIEKSLSKNRTFLVLDGISKFEQLDVLIGTKGLHPGSKIIITSKNGSLTEKCRLFETQIPLNHTKHLLQGVNDEESLQLLTWHAVGHNELNVGDKKVAMKVVKYCQGHPLALTVLGSSLRSEDDTWEDILESLGKEINPDITKVLKRSFDTLPSEKDKELFKHIACLFAGENRKFTEDILKACGICKPSGIKILINRCLLTVDNDVLMMHQLLQEMGRDIVRQESPKKPWKRSILCHHEDCLDVLQNRRGTTLTQGLVLDMCAIEKEPSKESRCVDTQKFEFQSFPLLNWISILLSVIWWLFGGISRMLSSSHKKKGDFETLSLSEMCNLKLLQLNYVQLSGSYKNFPQGLRWLCMHGFPLSYIPSDLQMEYMVALDMSNSKLQQLWKEPKLRSLKFLNLSNCYELVRVGHFSSLPLLERLTLKRCTSLVEVCESIGNCHKLEVLDLRECGKLKEFPRSIGKLKKLTQLLLDGFSDHGKFLTVENINMNSHGSSSSAMNMIPRSSKSLTISLPRSLVHLSLKNCNLHNESFPLDFSSLSLLTDLALDGNQIDSMPDCVRSLNRLKTLQLYGCSDLKTVMCPPIMLTLLNIQTCHSLEKITFHPEQSLVPAILYLGRFTITEIQHKFKIQALSEIDEEVLRSLGWVNIVYLNQCRFSKADCYIRYFLDERILPAQMLYELGIFSTYLQGQEVPKWFTHRSSGSLFTLQSAHKNCKVRGLNVCIVSTVTSIKEVGPLRIKITNLTKNSSWTYEPMMYLVPARDAFEDGGEVDVVWLGHWMFGKNEFEDGDQVSIQLSVKVDTFYDEAPNVREYGVSLVYDDDDDDDDDNGGGRQKEDALGYYKSWKHIIGGDLSAFETSPSHYLLNNIVPNQVIRSLKFFNTRPTLSNEGEGLD